MNLMNPTYGLYGFSHFWPAWVHLIVMALMVVSGGLTVKALVAHAAGRRRVYGLGWGFVAGLGNLCLSVAVHAEARHVWQLGTVIAIYAVNPNAALYTYLLALSGFSGAMAWISICWSQYRRRRKCEAEGTASLLRYRMPLFPYVTLFGIWAQVLCLAFMIFTPELRSALYLGIPMLIVPMILYRFLRRG